MRPPVLLGLLLTVAPLPAGAAVDPCVLDRMVAEAPTVVQVTEVEVDDAPRGSQGLHCRLAGVVARSFRGGLAVGGPVAAEVPCRPLPDEMAGELRWHAPRALRRAGAVELHLDADGAPAAYGAGVALLPAPTAAPARAPLCPAP